MRFLTEMGLFGVSELLPHHFLQALEGLRGLGIGLLQLFQHAGTHALEIIGFFASQVLVLVGIRIQIKELVFIGTLLVVMQDELPVIFNEDGVVAAAVRMRKVHEELLGLLARLAIHP